ncbi:MmcQ/YjbR family DNA-binding protein [Aegicerativicinus sediminis]|uniref:MmcQ/YjbR family DNA-binding protein n=1 Tax=Aegicerativicinus sediminis TaxID=2893202 RepID=UPI00293BA4D7|nr:MmcQ/YjbR family DNA-binding protein [Aegicerativicinus sediminis]
MINADFLRDYCLRKKGVTEGFPFDGDTLVLKVMGKMFALISLEKFEEGKGSINLKCDPEYALELRETYNCITPGYHMSKVHWNTVEVQSGEISIQLITELIDHSYQKVVETLTNKLKAELEGL